MKAKPALWTALALLAVLLVCSLILPPVGRPRRQAHHIQSVNVVHSVSFTLTNTNAMPGARP